MLNLLAEHWLLAGFAILAAGCAIIALYDITQQKHTILHNFPVVGHLRYFLETVGPEMRQYWVANDKEEMPFNRDERSWIYASAKGADNTFGFGTTEQLYGVGYPIVKHATFPFPESQAARINGDPTAVPCLKVMGAAHDRRRPYRAPSIINISAMSFGSLGARAISALNLGAAQAGCYHNTGEGGVSPYHCLGADIVWQIGTGYFGARGSDGQPSVSEMARKTAENDKIRAIEIKLSQGAKPGKGGILPKIQTVTLPRRRLRVREKIVNQMVTCVAGVDGHRGEAWVGEPPESQGSVGSLRSTTATHAKTSAEIRNLTTFCRSPYLPSSSHTTSKSSREIKALTARDSSNCEGPSWGYSATKLPRYFVAVKNSLRSKASSACS